MENIHLPKHLFIYILAALFSMHIGSTFVDSIQCQEDQKTLLLQLKKSLIYDPSHSAALSSWNHEAKPDCCSWDGVGCDGAGRVISLILEYEGITGGFNEGSSLFGLRHLEKLSLEGNFFQFSEIPRGFHNLTHLKELSLSEADFGGIVPESIFQVPNLQILDLSYNTNLSGTIPNSIGDLRMLSQISFNGCQFSGPIPSTFANLTELTYVDLSKNLFSGPVPLFHRSKKIFAIHLNDNHLTGSLSSMHFEGLSSLDMLELQNNLLSGILPESIFSLPSLMFLRLRNNQFSGRVNEFSFSQQLSSNIEEMDLSGNLLEGPIPESFFKLENLTELSLSSNRFCGTFHPEKIKRLQNLALLDLSYNNLSVDNAISSSLSTSPQLYSLNLASCNLYHFPNLLRDQFKLLALDLSNNRITGEIPAWIWEVGNISLAYFNLSFNHLTGFEVPYHISKYLNVLDLQSNQLEGELPQPPSLKYLDYSNNNFAKPIPHNFGNNISDLVFVSLANNRLIGAIPTSFCNMTQLGFLDLSGNQLSGHIPPCLMEDMGSLELLNLRSNNMNGEIPNKFSVNCSIQSLELRKNNLVGKVPPSLANCKSLKTLDLGNNDIHDSFPCMLSSSLRVLVLRSNRFYGEVRCHRKSWMNVQIIDVAINNFSGKLYPESFLSWKGMMSSGADQLIYTIEVSTDRERMYFDSYYEDTVNLIVKGLQLEIVELFGFYTSIDFSCNNFQGDIPDEIGELSSLYLLNLSRNSITGTIPRSIGNLKQLGSLDLSTNLLAGEIPKELGSLTFLSFLNLSSNKLNGMIPRGPQLQTFSEASYEGNTGLCGFPVSRSCNNITRSENGQSPMTPEYEKTSEIEWDFVSAALGFVVGLGSFLWMLFCCQNWREEYFEKVDGFLEKIFFNGNKQTRKRKVLRNQIRGQ